MFATTVKTLGPRLKLKLGRPDIENGVFKMHFQVTVTALILCLILVCSREYFGDHIRCISDNGLEDKVIDTYCFVMATFTIVKYYNESMLQAGQIPHPGVGPPTGNDDIIIHSYYQWVPFVLIAQAVCFYMPHYIWKRQEGGRIKMLVDGLQYAVLPCQSKELKVKAGNVPSKQEVEKKLNRIKHDILLRFRITGTWSTWLVAMEIINLLHIIFEIWIINIFLKGQFLTLGTSVIKFRNWEGIINPLVSIFPKVTKCDFRKYGPSGTLQKHDALCVMGLNIIHEKIYTAMWFWFLILFIASVLAVIWRIATFFLYRRSFRFTELMFWRVNAGNLDRDSLVQVMNSCTFGDWLFLYYLAKNMQASLFQQLLTLVADDLKQQGLPQHYQCYQKKELEPLCVSNIGFDNEILKAANKCS